MGKLTLHLSQLYREISARRQGALTMSWSLNLQTSTSFKLARLTDPISKP